MLLTALQGEVERFGRMLTLLVQAVVTVFFNVLMYNSEPALEHRRSCKTGNEHVREQDLKVEEKSNLKKAELLVIYLWRKYNRQNPESP
jgi:hypothetical protein